MPEEQIPKYETLYRKGSAKFPDQGNLTDVRIGDAVSYRDDVGAHAAGRVAKVNVAARVLRLEPHVYLEYVLRPAQVLQFDQILKLERRNPLYIEKAAQRDL
jgi:hypothetical protein